MSERMSDQLADIEQRQLRRKRAINNPAVHDIDWLIKRTRELEEEVARLTVIVDDLELKDPGLVGFKRTWIGRAEAAEATLREREECWRDHVTELQSRILTLEQEGYVPELEAKLREVGDLALQTYSGEGHGTG